MEWDDEKVHKKISHVEVPMETKTVAYDLDQTKTSKKIFTTLKSFETKWKIDNGASEYFSPEILFSAASPGPVWEHF